MVYDVSCCQHAYPVLAARRYAALLADLEHPAWLPLLAAEAADDGSADWTPDLIRLAVVTFLTMIGFLHIRILRPLELWPWCLGTILHDDVAEETVKEVSQAFMSVHPCCAPKRFTMNFKRRVASQADLRSPDNLNFLRDVLNLGHNKIT